MSKNLSFTDELPVSAIWIQELLPVAMTRCHFRDWVIDGATRTATATRDLSQPGVLVRRETLQLVINWQSSSEESIIIKWSVFDYSQGQRGAEKALDYQERLKFLTSCHNSLANSSGCLFQRHSDSCKWSPKFTDTPLNLASRRLVKLQNDSIPLMWQWPSRANSCSPWFTLKCRA